MITSAMKGISCAIESLSGEPDLQDMVHRLQEMHGELSERLARGVQGEIFPNNQTQLPLQEEPPELFSPLNLERFVQTC